MNGPVISLEMGTVVHPMLRVTNLVNRYGFPEGSCVLPNKSAYMDGYIWKIW